MYLPMNEDGQIIGVRLRRAGRSSRGGGRAVVLHPDQTRVVLMLLGDIPADQSLLDFLNSDRKTGIIIATTMYIMRGRMEDVSYALRARE